MQRVKQEVFLDADPLIDLAFGAKIHVGCRLGCHFKDHAGYGALLPDFEEISKLNRLHAKDDHDVRRVAFFGKAFLPIKELVAADEHIGALVVKGLEYTGGV